MTRPGSKIFGIGLNKTGTSTLGAAGAQLGLRCKTWDTRVFESAIAHNERDLLWATIETHDLFEDFPYPLLYREIDARYPDSRFVLTTRRNAEDWLVSLKAHSMRARPGSLTNTLVYGYRYPHGREAHFIDFYERHNADARAFFKTQPGKFLEICWEEEAGWERLCGFLGVAAPEGPLPKANARAGKSVNPLRFAYNLGARLLGAPG